MGKDKRWGKTQMTPLQEALGDYYTAIIYNQPRLAKPTARNVKNNYSAAELRKKYPEAGDYHQVGQAYSGYLWQLRKTINRKEKRSWSDISYVDKLALVAHQEFTDERIGGKEVKLTEWMQALVKADKKLSNGKHRADIERIGKDYL